MKKKLKKQHYEYLLPRDDGRVAADAAVSGSIAAIQDGITEYTPVELDVRALIVCEQMKRATKARHISDDFYAFCETFKDNFIRNYTTKQKMFLNEETSLLKHIQEVNQMGGYEAAFKQMRADVIRTAEERRV